MVKMSARFCLCSLAPVLLVAWLAAAQILTTGRLTGTVTDPQGAVIPRAGIAAKNDRTGAEFRTFANGAGIWALSSVPSGNYTVSVTAQGFRNAVFKETKVDTDLTATVDATLQIGLTADTVEITASKFEEEVINAPATVTVVPERRIQALPSQNIVELLRAVPGMNVIQTSADELFADSRSATGVYSGAQLAMIDGRTIYEDSFGAIIWDMLPTGLDEIKQVEVIRGPASAVWGAYAMNGVINIITKPPREMLGTTFTLGIGTFDRSGGGAESDRGSLYYVSATHAQALNDRWAIRIAGGFHTQDAFARPQGTIPNIYHTPYPPVTTEGTSQPKVDARADYDRSDGKQHFTFSGGFASRSGMGSMTVFGPTTCRQRQCKVTYGEMDYVHDALRITGFVKTHNADFLNLLILDPTGQQSEWRIKDQTYAAELSDSRMVQAKHLISYGGSFRHNEFNLSITPEAKSRNEGGVYSQDEILLSEHFRWVIGARVDKAGILKGVVFSPRTTFMVKPAPSQTFRLSYNRAYVAPPALNNYLHLVILYTLDLGLFVPQLAGNYYSFPMSFEGNRDLKEQSLNAYEIGYSGILANGRINMGAAFYINDSKGGLYDPQTGSYTSQNPPPGWPLPPFVLDLLGLPSTFTQQNLGKVRNKGIELNVEARLSRYISGYANYSWQARPEPEDFDISLLNLPPGTRFNAGLDFDYKRYLSNVSVGYVGSANWMDVLGALYSGATKAYTAVNLGGGVRWGGGRKYLAMLKISNLANTPIQNHIFGDILKRQISAEFKMRF